MTGLKFSLAADATSKIQEAVVCLAKFGEHVSFEARDEKLILTTLNSSRTTYASFSFTAATFFISYSFSERTAISGGNRFVCQFHNKALQSVFKSRHQDGRGRESLIERCDISIDDGPDRPESRLVARLICRHGMTRTYRITFEAAEVMHALFDKSAANQGWRISARVLRDYVEYFGSKTEQLDMLAQAGKAVFTSFTEKIQDGKEVLKQPLETAIAIHTEDFEDFHVQDNVHVIISVRDFKAIVAHAETMRAAISAQFSFPTRPLQFSYGDAEIRCEFTLMTTGDPQSSFTASTPEFVSTRSTAKQPSIHSQRTTPAAVQQPPLAGHVSLLRTTKEHRKGARTDRPSLKAQLEQAAPADREPDPDSLFLPEEEDRRWDAPNHEAYDEETLGWDPTGEAASFSLLGTLRDSNRPYTTAKDRPSFTADEHGLEPTQRLSQVSLTWV